MSTCVQVSVTAEQNCRLLTWSSSRLRQHLTCDSHLLLVFDLIIGNDIASKLYSTRCRSRHTEAASSVGVPATRSLPLQLNVEYNHHNHRSVHAVRGRPGRPEELPLKSRLPSFSGIEWNILLYSCVDRDSFVNKTYLYYDLFITTIGREGDWHLAGISPHQSGRAIFGQPAAKNEKKPVRLEAQFFGC